MIGRGQTDATFPMIFNALLGKGVGRLTQSGRFMRRTRRGGRRSAFLRLSASPA
jgi:hypothetical protein